MKDNILVTGKHGFIGRAIKNGKPFEGGVLDYVALWKQTIDIEGIVHLAAKSNKRICEDEPRQCVNVNLMGLCNILDIALSRKIWVLFISTFQVKEKNLYGLSKLVGEELCRLYQKKGLKIKIIRLPIVYGPGDRTDKVVTKMINELKLGKKTKIETKDKFCFTYIKDVAKIIESEVSVLQNGFGEKYSLYQLRDGIKECLKND
jgi:nucleoside-diphosphate-sugar epimerase